jgi:hypothetical protein
VRRDHGYPPQKPKARAGAAPARARLAAFLRSLPDRALVDRLVRGRAWIPVLGVMLAGIVAMQVEVLKLGASVGRSIERSSALETRNQLLRASVASLSDEARIERLAAGMGMIMPAPGSAGFVSGPANVNLEKALANIHAPDPAAFVASPATNGTVATTTIMSPGDGSIIANPPSQGTTSGTATATTPSSASSNTTGASVTQQQSATAAPQSGATQQQGTTTTGG